jgi:hypothetical protein
MAVRGKRTRKKLGPNTWINLVGGRQTSITTKHGNVTYNQPTLGPGRRTITGRDYVETVSLDYRTKEQKKRDVAKKRAHTLSMRRMRKELFDTLLGQNKTSSKQRLATAGAAAVSAPEQQRSSGTANWAGRLLAKFFLNSLGRRTKRLPK